MGNESSVVYTKPKKFHLTPPKIFLQREDFFNCGHIQSGLLAKRITKDFICSPDILFGATLLLSEKISEQAFVQCDSDVAVRTNGIPYVNGGIRVVQDEALLCAKFSETRLRLAAVSTPNS